MSGRNPLMKSSPHGKRQTYYLEIPSRAGRALVNYFEFGTHFAVEGSVSLRIPSPITLRMMPGYRGTPIFSVIS
jgi:hypothetical protein